MCFLRTPKHERLIQQLAFGTNDIDRVLCATHSIIGEGVSFASMTDVLPYKLSSSFQLHDTRNYGACELRCETLGLLTLHLQRNHGRLPYRRIVGASGHGFELRTKVQSVSNATR